MTLSYQATNLVLVLAAFWGFLGVNTSKAQTPGHWERVNVAPAWAPVSVLFSDSAHGVILADSASGLSMVRAFWTADGGRTWNWPNPYPTLGTPVNMAYRPLASIGVDSFYLLAQYAVLPPQRSFDGGRTWQAASGYPFTGNVIGCKMFSGSTGYVVDATSVSTDVFATTDGGGFFTTGIGNSPDLSAYDALIVDSTNIWITAWSRSSKFMRLMKTSDACQSWSSYYPVDTTKFDAEYFNQIISSPNPKFLYAIGGGQVLSGFRYVLHTDFVKTTDGGSTWTSDSSIWGARVFRLRSPAMGKLWALVGNKAYSGIQDLASAPGSRGFADTLCYSSDNGETWVKDAKTFAGDTLTDMYWVDSTHGYITAWRDSSMIIYRYVAEGSGVVARPFVALGPSITMLNSPASEILSFSVDGIVGEHEITVTDLLGREVVHVKRSIGPAARNDLDIRFLPSGYYTLTISGSDDVIIDKGFLKD